MMGLLPKPPPNQPSVVLPAAAKAYLAKLSGPRTLAVAVSVAYVIRCTVDSGPYPPPNHAAVFTKGVIIMPNNVIPPSNVIVIV
jgi:hypothetical protein